MQGIYGPLIGKLTLCDVGSHLVTKGQEFMQYGKGKVLNLRTLGQHLIKYAGKGKILFVGQ